MKKQNEAQVQTQALKRQPHKLNQFSRKHVLPVLVRRRHVVMLALLGLLLLLEVLEHLVLKIYGEGYHILYDTTLYLLVVPFSIWLLINLLKETESERELAENIQDMNEKFNNNLGEANTWEALVQRVVEHSHQVAPKTNVTLYVINSKSLRLQPEAACSREGQVTFRPLEHEHAIQGQISGETVKIASPVPANRFDLPVTHNGQLVGMIQLEYPLDCGPSAAEIHALKSAVPVIALALERAMLENLAAEQAEASENQRQQIAQTLHDTLAQNISYLRLKLDQLTGENAIHEIGIVLQELEHMRATADEAYRQVRSTLDELDPTRTEDLVNSVFNQAQIISQRARFHLRTSQVGAAYPLPASTRQHILNIVREALHNVEKHAHAQQATLQLIWLEHELILKISDDGVGFNPLEVSSDGHYGLWIMQHRAQEMGGNIKIISSANNDGVSTGTEVTLWMPRPAYDDISIQSKIQEPSCES